LIIAYALINRYHILDIHPQKSWVRNLLDQGIDVYMVDWGTPTNMDKYLDLDDYVNGYLDNCVDFVRDESEVDNVSLQGYCTGGTIGTVYTSLHPEKIKNFVATAPVIDGWRDTTVVSNLAKHIDVDKMVDSIGNMPPEFMYYCFSILKPFEQGIEKYTNFFRNIENESFVDNFLRVEKWLGDTPPIPGELFKQWIRDIYQDNLLIQDKMYVGGKHISLKNITMPIFTQVAIGDHLVSPECSMPLHYAVGSEDKTLRVYPTGHVGMIASSLSQKKVLPELGQWLKEHSELR
jgi:polyhydroxyalkanoate synthase